MCAIVRAASVPPPKEHFGYEPGADYKLANYGELIASFEKVAGATDRLKLVEFGRSSEDRPMYVAFISDAENLRALDRYREISRRLALGQATADEGRTLSREGKAIHNADIQKGDLRSRFSTIILPSQGVDGLLNGWKAGVPAQREKWEAAALQRPEYCGGIGVAGLAGWRNSLGIAGHWSRSTRQRNCPCVSSACR